VAAAALVQRLEQVVPERSQVESQQAVVLAVELRRRMLLAMAVPVPISTRIRVLLQPS
jgi:hypothetical protein